jgi:hypothetical protein
MHGYQSDLRADRGPAAMCEAIYGGALFHLAPTRASLALVDDVHELLEHELGPGDPRYVRERTSEAALFEGIGRIRRRLYVDPVFHRHVVAVVEASGFDPAELAFDPVRLRVVAHRGHEDPRAAPLYYAHRDTWFALSQAVIAWWIAMHEVSEDQAFEVYPEWLERPIANTSEGFDYDAWARDHRALKIGWQDREAGREVHYSGVTGELAPGATVRLAATRGDNIVFSGAHLHQTLGHATGITRYSLDFRIVRLPDHEVGKGPRNVDNRSRGSATADYVRAADVLAPNTASA